jgi:mRNA interferase RelE/StbE
MSYELRFAVSALKEWKKLNTFHGDIFKKKLSDRLIEPRVPADALRGLKDCYKIKLRSSGLRLVYRIDDRVITVTVLAVGRRDGSEVYTTAARRLGKD